MAKVINKNLLILRLIFWLAVPILLLVLPADFFDGDKFVVCPSRLLFDVECLGCGMTRAVMHLIHFDVESALFYNMGSIVIGPALAFLWAKWAWPDFRQFWESRSST